MSIDAKDIKVDNRYLCEFPYQEDRVVDCLIVEFASVSLQDKKYVKIRWDNGESLICSRWMTLDTLLSLIIEKLEDQDENYMGEVYGEISADDIENSQLEGQLQSEHEKNKEKIDYLQEFAKVQTEYLKMLMKEKKDSDGWKK